MKCVSRTFAPGVLAAAASAAVVSAAPLLRAATAPELIIDLRLPGGAKSASVSDVGDTVSLQLCALVRNDNPGMTDGFNATQGAWMSLNGGLKGNLSTSLVVGFGGGAGEFGGFNPAPADLDGDGDLDVGAPPSATSGHWIASAGASGNFISQGSENIDGETYSRWLIGTGVFTVTDIGGYQTQLNYVPRAGSPPVNPHKYYSDSNSLTSILGTDPRLQIGAPISITGPVIWTGGVGNWSTAGKWNSGVVPGAAGESVLIDNDPASSAVTLDVNAAVNHLTISSGDFLTVASSRSLTVNGTLTNSGMIAIAAGGNALLAGACVGNGTISNDGALTFATAAAPATIGPLDGLGTLTVQAGRSLSASHMRQGSAQIDGIVRIRPNGGATGSSRSGTLTLGPSGKLDLSNNSLVLHNTAGPGTWTGTAYNGVTGQIASGRGTGTWNGATGIITSQTTATGGSNFTSLGVALASDVRPATLTATSVWAGQTITGTDTLVMYTYGGDANLDGKINIDDYVRIDQGIAAGLKGWSNGDFNYDGKVNIDDYTTVIDSNIGNQGAPFFTAQAIEGQSVVAVPEPATIFVGLAVLTICDIRRGRRVRSGRC
jgi:hypothetical protein